MVSRYGGRGFLRRDLRQRADYFANQSIEQMVSSTLRVSAASAHFQRYAAHNVDAGTVKSS